MTSREKRIQTAKEMIARRNNNSVIEWEDCEEEPIYKKPIDFVSLIKSIIVISIALYIVFLVIIHISLITSFITKGIILALIVWVIVNSPKQSNHIESKSDNLQKELDKRSHESWELMQRRSIQTCRNLGTSTQVVTIDGNGKQSNGFCLTGVLQGYTSSSVTVRRGNILVTYDAYGNSIGPTMWAS